MQPPIISFLGRDHQLAANPGEGACRVDVELVCDRSPHSRPHVLKRIRRGTSSGKNIIIKYIQNNISFE